MLNNTVIYHANPGCRFEEDIDEDAIKQQLSKSSSHYGGGTRETSSLRNPPRPQPEPEKPGEQKSPVQIQSKHDPDVVDGNSSTGQHSSVGTSGQRQNWPSQNHQVRSCKY